MRPGDLIFFRPYGSVSHVAIYAGNGMVWESPGTGQQVRYAGIWDVPRSYGRF
ncbi:MAG: NlpC/P60 family protein [Nocardioidaceae bacterium]